METGAEVVVLDNLCLGHRAAVHPAATLEVAAVATTTAATRARDHHLPTHCGNGAAYVTQRTMSTSYPQLFGAAAPPRRPRLPYCVPPATPPRSPLGPPPTPGGPRSDRKRSRRREMSSEREVTWTDIERAAKLRDPQLPDLVIRYMEQPDPPEDREEEADPTASVPPLPRDAAAPREHRGPRPARVQAGRRAAIDPARLVGRAARLRPPAAAPAPGRAALRDLRAG